MKRREFVTLFTSAVGLPLAARAQHQGKMPRIGYLDPHSVSNPYIEAFRTGLRDLGYIEGRNIRFEPRWADGDYDRLPALADELVRLDIDVLVTYSNPGVLAAKQATTTIPIVIAISGDAVGSGLVGSLNRPGGNLTGQTFFNPELNAKRLEILKEALPQSTRIAVFFNPTNPITFRVVQAMALTASSLGLELANFEVRRPGELASTFSTMVAKQVDAVAVVEDAVLIPNARVVVELATAHRLPSIGF